MGQFGIGQSVKRFEDVRLLRGEGRFHHDVNLPGQAHMVVVRSTHAHARIRRIDTARARALPGVLAVITGKDLVVTKENEKVVVSFAYDKEVELVKPVFLLIKFEGRSVEGRSD